MKVKSHRHVGIFSLVTSKVISTQTLNFMFPDIMVFLFFTFSIYNDTNISPIKQ